LNIEMNQAHTYGDRILSEEYEKRIERKKWFKNNKIKLIGLVSSVTAFIAVIAFLFYMI